MNEMLDQRLLEILGRYLTDPGELEAAKKGSPLLAASGLDSLSVVNLVTELELLFEVRFDSGTLRETLHDIHSLQAFLRASQARSV